MYRNTWLGTVALAGAVGLWGAVQALTLGGTLTLFLITALGAACIGLTADEDGPPPSWRQGARLGVNWGAGVVAGVGLIAMFRAVGLLVVAVLVISSPRVLALARRYRSARSGEAAGRGGHARASYDELTSVGHHRLPGPEPEVAPVTDASLLEAPWLEQGLESMDDQALCFAWRMSFVAMQRPLSPPLRLRIVTRRQQFLDELERRHPRGFSAWLDSGARAAGDPSRYIGDAEWRTDH